LTEDNSNLVDIDDLDKFEDAFFQRTPEKEEVVEDEPEDEEVDETEDDTLEPDEDQDAEEEEDAPDEDEDPEEEELPAPKAKGKKSFQQRIDELTADKYESKREIEARDRAIENLRKELEKFAGRSPEEKVDEAPTLRQQLAPDAPKPDAVDDKGEAIYPLGEFDPRYIRDLTKFTIVEETKAAKEEAAREAALSAKEAQVNALSVSWNEKLEKAEEAIPDIREEIKSMVDVFADIEPSYGEYLATTIMSSDLGVEVMHYLSQNIGEAQKIVASGPAAATLALGRLEGKLSVPAPVAEQRTTKKVSEAPPAPESRSRGRGGQFAVKPDTDDLDAFEKVFFNK
jgi:hypothetical protein